MQIYLIFGFLGFIILFETKRFIHDRKKKNRILCCPNPECGYSAEGKEFGTLKTDYFPIMLFFFAIVPYFCCMLYFRISLLNGGIWLLPWVVPAFLYIRSIEYPVIKCPRCRAMIGVPH